MGGLVSLLYYSRIILFSLKIDGYTEIVTRARCIALLENLPPATMNNMISMFP